MISADAASSPGRIAASSAFSSLGREPVERLARFAQRRVLQVALLAAGAADQHGVHALGVVLGERRRALRRLVVGVGVNGQQRQAFGHLGEATGRRVAMPDGTTMREQPRGPTLRRVRRHTAQRLSAVAVAIAMAVLVGRVRHR